MAEYIDRESMKQALRNAHIYLNGEDETVIEIEDIPAADVQPVKHGRWVSQIYANYECSVCGFYETEKPYNYCPNCGADMRGE